ncbi:hypothetical protein [Inquilinus limosus]|uniref:Uncharacterized protein n=1 Tax=Inquilinus limosus MP06 TaxID=1398085 RepID=A0A0A0D9F4_9PROT|nr:hypothetical protein [Inquilinus limosus]KGM34685.1 hypothetical protein P409_08780 [Inquilinus limosus MP06]
MPRDIIPSDIDPAVIAYDSFVAAHRAYESAAAAEDTAFAPEPRVVLFECTDGHKKFARSLVEIDEWARKRADHYDAVIKEIRNLGLSEEREAETIAFAVGEKTETLDKLKLLRAELRQRKAEHMASGAPTKMKTLKRAADAALKAERKAIKDLFFTPATTVAGVFAKFRGLAELGDSHGYVTEDLISEFSDEGEAIERRRSAN